MATIITTYTGDLRTEAIHLQSSRSLITDAPIDNQGKGEAFSPTDLLAASLGSCMLTIMGIASQTHGFPLEGTRAEITKVMASAPRRIGEIIIDLYFPANNYSDKTKQIIRQSAFSCPVYLSLSDSLIKTIHFHF